LRTLSLPVLASSDGAATLHRVTGPRPLDEEVAVNVRPAEIGTKSLKLEFEMRVGDRLLADGYGVLVGFDYATQETIAIPSSYVQDCAVMRNNATDELLVLVAGPYRSGTGDDPEKLAANVQAMNAAALDVFRAGHLPVTGEALALPLIELAGSTRVGDAAFDGIFHPIARRLLERCDAVLRIGGASAGADEMVEIARAGGKPVFQSVAELPPC
jgi:hypothetical protein